METNRNKGVLACCHFRVVRKSPAEVTFEPRPSGSSEKSHRKRMKGRTDVWEK